MSIWTSIENGLKNLTTDVLKPFISKEIGYLANDLQAAEASLQGEAGVTGQAAVDAIVAFVTDAVSKNALLSLVASQLLPSAQAYLDGLLGAGVADVPTLIAKLVAWLQQEETVL